MRSKIQLKKRSLIMKDSKKKNTKDKSKKKVKLPDYPRGHKIAPKHEVLDWMDSYNHNYFGKLHVPR
jgi:hypothetical protein